MSVASSTIAAHRLPDAAFRDGRRSQDARRRSSVRTAFLTRPRVEVFVPTEHARAARGDLKTLSLEHLLSSLWITSSKAWSHTLRASEMHCTTTPFARHPHIKSITAPSTPRTTQTRTRAHPCMCRPAAIQLYVPIARLTNMRVILSDSHVHPGRRQVEEQAPKPPPVAKYVVSGGLTGMPVATDIQFIDFSAVDPATPYAEAKAIPWNMEINPEVGVATGNRDPRLSTRSNIVLTNAQFLWVEKWVVI